MQSPGYLGPSTSGDLTEGSPQDNLHRRTPTHTGMSTKGFLQGNFQTRIPTGVLPQLILYEFCKNFNIPKFICNSS